jgi:hypothetical protein
MIHVAAGSTSVRVLLARRNPPQDPASTAFLIVKSDARQATIMPKKTRSARKAPRRRAAAPARPRAYPRRRHYAGPREWLYPMLEEVYSKLGPKEEVETALATLAAPAGMVAGPAARPNETVLASLPLSHWQGLLGEYHRRRVAARSVDLGGAMARGLAAVPGQNNWTPLGPGVLARGQTTNRAAVSGRISGLAIAPGGLRAYVATANGGVWRSDNGGVSWRSTMDGFDQDPTNFASTSLACGAIAIDPAAPDRVYVGTGEGDTDALFGARITNALPSYRGIGPIRSDDGGQTWVGETSSPSLAGFAFFQMAVDPADREHVVAATTNGLYERVPAAGGFTWERRRTGVHTAVVVARAAGVTTWFAAARGDRVYRSTNGNTWASAGTGFPTGAGRIALGVQPDNPNVLYAFIATAGGALHSVRRLDGGAGAWQNITGVPAVLPGSQGDYDLCIAVDPNDANRIYLGGDFFNASPFPGSIWRCAVTASSTGFSMTAVSIGQNAHADVHALAHVPGDSSRLWAGTDGGLFVHANATGAGGFEARNTGLHTLCVNFLGQHPTEPAVLYVGLQDNGTAKGTGEQVWRHVLFADGGYCVVNWNDPFRVLLFANGNVFRATDGGLDYTSWTQVTPPGATWQVMAEPLVGPPRNPASPAEADIVAFGVGRTIFISSDFGTSWPDQPTLPAGSGSAFAMVFASATRLFVGTTIGRVFRLDDTGPGGWTVTRLDNAAGGALPLAGLVTDIAVDRSDATLRSVYISFGGSGDFRHVWRFDGTAWAARSGTAGSGTELLDVEHNALQYDTATNRLYVGADIGVWESADGGSTWAPLSNGLPDAPVYDLQIHPGSRLLRAALHGRGVWEWKLDPPVLPDVELYIRDTMLDTGRGENTDGRSDPSIFPTGPVFHYLGPNIKVDVPTPLGYQTPTTAIDFLTFNEVIVDGSNGVATNAPPPTVHNRVYVEVHNRGRVDAAAVQVMAAITNAATGLLLPAGYTANVTAGTALPGPAWTTIGVRTLSDLRAGHPQIVHFDLPSTVLPLPASLPGSSHYCMVVFLHSAQDPFTSTQRNVDLLTLADRKVGQKNLHIVEFVGTPPPPGTGPGVWAMLVVRGAFVRRKAAFDLVVDARRFPGRLYFALPGPLVPADPATQAKGFKVGSNALVSRWAEAHARAARRLFYEAKYPEAQYKLLVAGMEQVAGQRPLVLDGGRLAAVSGLPIGPRDEHVVFFRIDLPERTKAGSVFEFDVFQRDSRQGTPQGASRYRVVVNRKAG